MADDRFRAQAEAFIAGVMKADIPDVTVDEGSAINALVVKSGGAIASATFQEIEHTQRSRDISDPEGISVADMDKNLENLLVTRPEGNLSTGPVNFHFSDRRRRQFTAGQRVSSKDGLSIFVLGESLLFEEFDHIANPDDGTYFVRVTFSADTASPEYDLDVGSINTIVDNNVGALYCRNPEKFQGGLEAMSNTEFLRFASRAVSTRLPINVDGTTLMLQRMNGLKLLDVLCIGNGDPEMLRDELHRQVDGSLDLVPTGTPTGIHIGGRQDVMHWYRRINYVEVTIDLSVDLILKGAVSPGATTMVVGFAAGTTTENSVPEAGKFIIELGSGNEETLRYTSQTFNPTTQEFTLTLASPVTLAHANAATAKIAGDGRIPVGPGTKVSVLPVLKVQSVTLLDPLTLSPVGSALPQVSPVNRVPGWYIDDVDKFTHMSAKETKSIVIAEKQDVPGVTRLSVNDGDVDSVARTLVSANSNFTGYQGRDIAITQTGGVVTATIAKVLTSTTVVLAPGPALATESLCAFTIEDAAGDFLQYAIRVGYYTHLEIQSAQVALDAGRTRIVAGNSLSRAFYPVFLDFRLRYRGTGTVASVRETLLNLVQAAQGTSFGVNEGARFEVSDIVSAAYSGNNADYVETPFEIRVATVNQDGTVSTQWVSPGPNTVNTMVVATTAVAPGDTTVRAKFPASGVVSAVPAQGKLFLGAFDNNQEVVTYSRWIVVGDDFLFILDEGLSAANVHAISEPLRVSVSEFDPAAVITDGVINQDRIHRPYFGVVVVGKLG